MKEFRKLLFPVVLSEPSEIVVPYVQTVATKFKSQIHLLFVVRVFDHFTSMYVPMLSIDKFAGELFEGAQKRLYEFRDNHFNSFSNTVATVVAGDASEEILNYIQTRNIDLVVMGTHGRKGLDKVIFGSVAEQIVKTAPVPVLVINPYRLSRDNDQANEKTEIEEEVHQK